MPTSCCCGNELDPGPKTKIRMSPCRCEQPASQKRTIHTGIPSHVFETQFNERKRTGLPLETDIEKGVRTRWV